MAINDLLEKGKKAIVGISLGMGLIYGCSGGGAYDCETFCQWETDECLLPGKDFQSNVSKCVDECQQDAPTYDATTCFSCAKSYNGTQEEKCGAFKQCIDNNCGDFT